MILRYFIIGLLFSSAAAVAAGLPWRDMTVASDPDVVNDKGYLAHHPDQRWRAEGVEALRADRSEEAVTYFRRAARYADKPSQAMLAAMFWEGDVVARDRPTAYAWMDLAAERGYRDYLIAREQYWAKLSEDERATALKVGATLYDECGDAVAQPRMNRELRRARSEMTGSRVGFIGSLTIIPLRTTGLPSMRGDEYYDARHWDPKRYWQAQDQLWDPPQGHAEVGPLQSLAEPTQR
ncbi:MAG: hypothetical protein WBP11_04770 [Dokdonella sp.]